MNCRRGLRGGVDGSKQENSEQGRKNPPESAFRRAMFLAHTLMGFLRVHSLL